MAVDSTVMARAFAYFFALGGCLTLLTLALPSSSGVSSIGVILPLVLAFAGVAVFLTAFERLPPWSFHIGLSAAVLLVAAIVHSSGSQLGNAYATMWFWSAITAFSFFRRTHAMLHVASIAIVYALILHLRPGVEGEAAQWVMIMGAIVVAGMMIGVIRTRLEHLLARMGHVARTDVLTGLVNRRGFEELSGMELGRSRRTGRSFSLVVVDLDHFKQVNDRLGHKAGDEALARLGRVLQDATRQVDIVARLGGEEFVILAPESSEDLALALAERVRGELADAFADYPIPLTASCGVATYPAHGRSADELLEAADRALYVAKESGRNRSVLYRPEIDRRGGLAAGRSAGVLSSA